MNSLEALICIAAVAGFFSVMFGSLSNLEKAEKSFFVSETARKRDLMCIYSLDYFYSLSAGSVEISCHANRNSPFLFPKFGGGVFSQAVFGEGHYG